MPITLIDPRTALVVIDLQRGIAALPTVHPIAAVTQQAALLADAFRRARLPVVLVNVTGRATGRCDLAAPLATPPAGWDELLPELNSQPTDHLLTKRAWGAFTDTNLGEYLASLEVTQVVLAGVATSIGVESTARAAHELGLNVTLAIDAMTDMSAEAHENSVSRIFPRLGETGATQDILDRLPPLQP
jgi:nicotinamidase-related amidase